MEKLEWSALEYEEKERNADWFWALGVIIIASSAASIIYGNYFFAILLVLSGILLGFFAKKKPDIILYELNEKGLKIRTRLFPYENIKSFWVQVGQPTQIETKSTLFIKSERFFMPIISIPINDSLADEIQFIMLTKNITEEEMKEHLSEKIMEVLGF
ncbi:hypothetical protein A3B85_00920 [Candidatus Nomurabacteria bacterium RIFCSPHIGHO2_02_FULL_37_13]|uniref:DUF5673 domain-containing protein n=1 Tax=Candidatus Nomurabacteria bacterium RIFCSPHIGHO2_02_FULL_37_13 TaxID=1801750 RepID=A0A1F6W4K8_9BACT|nr:MAG: hypothetical protein A2640_02700 [Candidatus Nomurabacteria bacterium RIFCSPHIGHO2_01_FULL_36_23]OGI76615.1 MAG: hypothetical protein A3B85_00920 [Candidatus Nomurabacteria bacterium RIFCSPHIGHO2_02_FULL_37_13]OGI87522.1 MAG: hypothetical protein A2906_01035 [Candidatus Nomurabacteria bacterium RIFCSPLOWO2_01_FULL_37_25]